MLQSSRRSSGGAVGPWVHRGGINPGLDRAVRCSLMMPPTGHLDDQRRGARRPPPRREVCRRPGLAAHPAGPLSEPSGVL